MKDILDDPEYIDMINELVNITTNSGTSYGNALEKFFADKTPKKNILLKNIMSQVIENYKKSDNVIDNNIKHNDPFYVIDLAVTNKKNMEKILLELKNQISSRAKIPKWKGTNTMESINNYEKKYNDKKKEYESKYEDAKKNKNIDDIKNYREILKNFRQYYDINVNEDGTLLTDNKIGGAEGSTVPKYNEERKLIRIDEYNWGKIKPGGKKIPYSEIDTKAIFLQDGGLVNYDISKDSNNHLVKEITIMSNETGKPVKDYNTNLPIKRTIKYVDNRGILHNPKDEYFMTSTYPLKQKIISGKPQLVRVLPPHKMKIIKNK